MTMILHTCRPKTGTITVSKVITGAPEDMTVFRCTLTGQSATPTIVGPFDLSQEAPSVLRNLPFDTYVLTEEVQPGHTQTSVHDPIVLTRASRNQSVTVVNEVAPSGLELTFKIIDDVVQWPVADPTNVQEWNALFSAKVGAGSISFFNVLVDSNKAVFNGFDDETLSYFNLDNISLIEIKNANTLYPIQQFNFQENLLIELPILPDNLESLFCAFCQLTTFPQLFTWPETVSELVCNNNKLTSVPTLPFSLEVLFLQNNLLDTTNVNSVLLQLTDSSYANLIYIDLRMTISAPPTPSIKSAFISAHPLVELYTD